MPRRGYVEGHGYRDEYNYDGHGGRYGYNQIDHMRNLLGFGNFDDEYNDAYSEDDSYGRHYSGEDEDDYSEEDEDDHGDDKDNNGRDWETSSTESRTRLLARPGGIPQSSRGFTSNDFYYSAQLTPNSVGMRVYRIDEMTRTFLPSFKVCHLKDILGRWNLPKAGNKPVLLQRVIDYLRANFPNEEQEENSEESMAKRAKTQTTMNTDLPTLSKTTENNTSGMSNTEATTPSMAPELASTLNPAMTSTTTTVTPVMTARPGIPTATEPKIMSTTPAKSASMTPARAVTPTTTAVTTGSLTPPSPNVMAVRPSATITTVGPTATTLARSVSPTGAVVPTAAQPPALAAIEPAAATAMRPLTTATNQPSVKSIRPTSNTVSLANNQRLAVPKAWPKSCLQSNRHPSQPMVSTTPSKPTWERYAALLEDLNNVYSAFHHGYRPFMLPPAPLANSLVERLSNFNFDYGLPYPWIIEEKLSPPLVSDLLPHDRAFSVPQTRQPLNNPGVRVLLVVLKFRLNSAINSPEGGKNSGSQQATATTITATDSTSLKEDQSHIMEKQDTNPTREDKLGSENGPGKTDTGPAELLPFSKQKPGYYRHAYGRDFGCFFNGRFFTPYYEVSKIHTVTSYLSLTPNQTLGSTSNNRSNTIDWMFQPLPPRYHKGYFFQLVSAQNNPGAWIRDFNDFVTHPASLILNRLRQHYGKEEDRHGISTSAIRISMHCPLSLQRLVTPVRTKHCRHPQCFELSSINLTTSNNMLNMIYARCPICEVNVNPENLFIDGLVMEMLQHQPPINEAIINPMEGTWHPVVASSKDASMVDPFNINCAKDKAATTLISPEDVVMAVEATKSGTSPKDQLMNNNEVITIDLTLTPDEPVDPVSIFIKPDPGIAESSAETSITPIMPEIVEIPSDPVALDDGDVLYLDDEDVNYRAHIRANAENAPHRPWMSAGIFLERAPTPSIASSSTLLLRPSAPRNSPDVSDRFTTQASTPTSNSQSRHPPMTPRPRPPPGSSISNAIVLD